MSAPLQRNAQVKAMLIDPFVSVNAAPNRVRDYTAVTNGPLGTLIIRRKFKNSTGQSITRLRFRIADLTTLGTPNAGGAQADLRVINSVDVTVTTTSGNVLVRGTTLEDPPTQAIGGGLNTSLACGAINFSTPLQNGASVNVQFTLGVQAVGSFRFLVNVEAAP
jgi:hypothetical protein